MQYGKRHIKREVTKNGNECKKIEEGKGDTKEGKHINKSRYRKKYVK